MADSATDSGAALLPSDLDVSGDVELAAVGANRAQANEEDRHVVEAPTGEGGHTTHQHRPRTENQSNEGSQQPKIDPNKDIDKVESPRRKPPAVVDPAKLLEPIRTDPIKALEARKRRLERQVEPNVPEIHYVGQILSMSMVINDALEGAFCR